MDRKPTVVVRVYPETKQKVEAAAQANDRTPASMFKLLVDTGLEQLRALKQTAHDLREYAQRRIRTKSRKD